MSIVMEYVVADRVYRNSVCSVQFDRELQSCSKINFANISKDFAGLFKDFSLF